MHVHGRSGFSLVEVLIVIIVVGILAAMAIPRFTSSSDQARETAMRSSLNSLQRAVELYRHEHEGVYPGAVSHRTGSPVATVAQAESAFVAQLERYSTRGGRTALIASGSFRYGPYLRQGLPVNPMNECSGITCDITETDVTKMQGNSADGTGWRFYVRTGRIIPNDGTPVSIGLIDQLVKPIAKPQSILN